MEPNDISADVDKMSEISCNRVSSISGGSLSKSFGTVTNFESKFITNAIETYDHLVTREQSSRVVL